MLGNAHALQSVNGQYVTTEQAPETGEPQAGEAEKAAADLVAPVRPALDPLAMGNQVFWRALALAVLLHGAMFVPLVGLSGNPTLQRRMGEAFGDANAINVDVIEAQSLPGDTDTPEPPPAPPPPPEQQPPQVVVDPLATPSPPDPPATEPVKEPPKEPTREPVKEPVKPPTKQPPQKAASPQPPPEKQPEPPAAIRGTTDPTGPVAEKPSPPPEPARDEKAARTAAIAKELTEMFAPEPPRKNPPSKQPPTQPSPRPADDAPRVLDRPPPFAATSSSFARPADITRSGENDEFGRGVIRALRQSMPAPWGVKARVTIMFYLTSSGQVAEMRLVQSSGFPLVDQSVVFAAGNSTFPRPPPGSKINDRIFLVTYIYD